MDWVHAVWGGSEPVGAGGGAVWHWGVCGVGRGVAPPSAPPPRPPQHSSSWMRKNEPPWRQRGSRGALRALAGPGAWELWGPGLQGVQ